MWHRKELKSAARKTMRGNYWRIIMVCIIISLLVGSSSGSSLGDDGEMQLVHFRTATNTEILNSIVHDYVNRDAILFAGAAQVAPATKGILAGWFNHVTRSQNVIFGTLNAINQFVLGDDGVGAGIIMIIGTVLTALYYVFIGYPLTVGQYRFFLESRSYPETKASRILFAFRLKRVRHTAAVMLRRLVYTTLWFFTIVGGVIKLYSYRMVPYILAENPDITGKEALTLSRRMMRGEKWRTFKLDLSFLGWTILSVLTMGLINILYLSPYKLATEAELYLRLRLKIKEENPGAAYYFNDPWLLGVDTPCGEYPTEKFPIPEHPARVWLTADYDRRYSPLNLVLMFFSFAMVGWVWEVFVDLINTGGFVNRGTMFGPWLPLYGSAGVLIILLFKRFAKRPILTFVLVTAFCAVVEYATSWALETFFGARWWDYSGYFLNLHGRICLEGLLVFGIAGSLGIYFLGPTLDNLLNKIPKKTRVIICTVLICLFLADLGYSSQHPNTAAVAD